MNGCYIISCIMFEAKVNELFNSLTDFYSYFSPVIRYMNLSHTDMSPVLFCTYFLDITV